MTMNIEEEYTVTDGKDFATLHKISVLLPSGQYLDSTSTAVKGIVRVSRMSKIETWEMSRSLVISLGFIGRTR